MATKFNTKKKIAGNFVAGRVFALAILAWTTSNTVQAQEQFAQPTQQLPNAQFNGQPVDPNMINNNYSANPIANPYTNHFAGMEMPKFKSDFWTNAPRPPQHAGQHIVDANTVLTGILQEDVSSKTSKPGDVFSILLADDYVVNDQVLIPKNSRFVGSVLAAAPAKKNLNGMPGNLQVSIQAIVNSVGVSVPVKAFIEYDPSQHTKIDTKKSRGVPVGEWAKSAQYAVHYTAGSIGSRLGIPLLYKGQTGGGSDLSVPKGELIPVKLSEALDTTPLLTPANQQNTQQNGPGNGQLNPQSSWQSNVPGFNPSQLAPMASPNNNWPSQSNNASSGQNNMLPGASSPAGPEPF